MTFGISRDHGAFEWAGTNLNSIFAQRENIFRPKYWRMIFDIIRFNQFALDLLCQDSATEPDLSVGEYIQREGYSDAFRDDYLIPMTACVWSTGADKCALDFPALTLVRFLWNHHLLSTLSARPSWLTIPGGSQQYIDAILERFPEAQVHLSKPVRSLLNDPEGRVILVFDEAENDTFDQVILACHGNQAMDIISTTASKPEEDILSVFHTTPNMAYMHSDTSVRLIRPSIAPVSRYQP